MKILAERDFGTTPEQYAAFLREQVAWAKKTLARPSEQWPRGSSHDIARQLVDECENAFDDLRLEFGLYSADGRLVGFQAA